MYNVQHFMPCQNFARAVKQVLNMVPDANPDSLLCSVHQHGTIQHLLNDFTLKLLRHVCPILGGAKNLASPLQK